jgi:hypothetical protein
MVNIDDFTVLCIGTEAEIVFLCSLLYRAGTGQRLVRLLSVIRLLFRAAVIRCCPTILPSYGK